MAAAVTEVEGVTVHVGVQELGNREVGSSSERGIGRHGGCCQHEPDVRVGSKGSRVANWDVFHADRLELERGLITEAIRSALARGELRDDDLVRPAGTTTPWARLADIPELMAAPAADAVPATSSPAFAEGRPGSLEFRRGAAGLRGSPAEARRDRPAPEAARADRACRTSSSSDVTFPVLEEDPGQPSPAIVARPERRPSPVWTWDDDDEEDDEEEESGRRPETREISRSCEDESDLEDLEARGRSAIRTTGPTRAPTSSPEREPAELGPVPPRSTGGTPATRISTWTSGPTARPAMWPCRSFDRVIGMRE